MVVGQAEVVGEDKLHLEWDAWFYLSDLANRLEALVVGENREHAK